MLAHKLAWVVFSLLAVTAVAQPQTGGISAIWANDGGDKVLRHELRSHRSEKTFATSVWKDGRVELFGLRNEVVSFALIIEAAERETGPIRILASSLLLKNGDPKKIENRISASPVKDCNREKQSGCGGLFDWKDRQIEAFFVRYLRVHGTGTGLGHTCDEHLSSILRRDLNGAIPPSAGKCSSGNNVLDWKDRFGANRDFPEIAVPLELEQGFIVSAQTSQTIWFDVYLRRDQAAGVFEGKIGISEEGGAPPRTIDVILEVGDKTLPDVASRLDTWPTPISVPQPKIFGFLSYESVSDRYFGPNFNPDHFIGKGEDLTRLEGITAAHHRLAVRHRLSLSGDDEAIQCRPVRIRDDQGGTTQYKELCDIVKRRLNGEIYDPKTYVGPGAGGKPWFTFVGPYGSVTGECWPLGERNCPPEALTKAEERVLSWQSWLSQNAPGTLGFLYLCDESYCGCPPRLEGMASELKMTLRKRGIENRARLFTLATIPNFISRLSEYPSLDAIVSSVPFGPAKAKDEEEERKRKMRAVQSVDEWRKRGPVPRNQVMLYGTKSPLSGTLSLADDGTAPRHLAWALFAKGVDSYFIWETTYYFDSNNPHLETSGRSRKDATDARHTKLFEDARTFRVKDFYPDGTSKCGNAGTLVESDSKICEKYGELGFPNSDGVLLYPGTDKVHQNTNYDVPGPIASLRLKHLRRGLQDIEYLRLATCADPERVGRIVRERVGAVFWDLRESEEGGGWTNEAPRSPMGEAADWEAARRELFDIVQKAESSICVARLAPGAG